MAKLTTKTEVVTYVLELSLEEASALRKVLGRVGGDPVISRRRLVQHIYDVLEAVKIDPGPDDLKGGLEFKETY